MLLPGVYHGIRVHKKRQLLSLTIAATEPGTAHVLPSGRGRFPRHALDLEGFDDVTVSNLVFDGGLGPARAVFHVHRATHWCASADPCAGVKGVSEAV